MKNLLQQQKTQYTKAVTRKLSEFVHKNRDNKHKQISYRTLTKLVVFLKRKIEALENLFSEHNIYC